MVDFTLTINIRFGRIRNPTTFFVHSHEDVLPVPVAAAGRIINVRPSSLSSCRRAAAVRRAMLNGVPTIFEVPSESSSKGQ